MMKTAIRYGSLALALWALATAPSLAKSVLVVQVRTNCRPMVDFHVAVVTVRDMSGRAVKRVNTPASPARNWTRGVRVAEIEVDEGNYRMKVGLRNRYKGMIVERPVRVGVKSGVRVVTVLLACPEQPRTGRGSAPGDPPPIPQAKKPVAPITPSRLPPEGVRPSGLKSKVCQNSVQGRIAWNHSGNRRWSQANIDRLCKGAENSTEPARCFQKIMHGNVSHGTNTRWRWQDALELCAGARNHRSRVDCFQRLIQQGIGQRAAISRCKNR